MKGIYAWAPWFRELAEKIAAGGRDDLIEKAKQVAWVNPNPALLNDGDENIDPPGIVRLSHHGSGASVLLWELFRRAVQGSSTINDIKMGPGD